MPRPSLAAATVLATPRATPTEAAVGRPFHHPVVPDIEPAHQGPDHDHSSPRTSRPAHFQLCSRNLSLGPSGTGHFDCLLDRNLLASLRWNRCGFSSEQLHEQSASAVTASALRKDLSDDRMAPLGEKQNPWGRAASARPRSRVARRSSTSHLCLGAVCHGAAEYLTRPAACR